MSAQPEQQSGQAGRDRQRQGSSSIPTTVERRQPSPRRRSALGDQARAVISERDRDGALALLLAIVSGGERAARQLPVGLAEALVAVAHGVTDAQDQAALRALRDAATALAIVRNGPLSADDLKVIRDVADERLRREQADQAAELASIVRAAAATLEGSAGRNLAVRFGRGHLEIKYIPHRATGKVHGPYLYARWREGKVQRSRYIGKPAVR